MTIRIETAPCSLKYEKPVEVKQSFIEWDEFLIRQLIEMTAETPKDSEDAALGMEETPVFFDCYAKVSDMKGVHKSWREKLKRWAIYISILGIPEDWIVYFKKQTECDEAFLMLVALMKKAP